MKILHGSIVLSEKDEYDLLINIIKILPPKIFVYGSSVVSLLHSSFSENVIPFDDIDIGLLDDFTTGKLMEIFCLIPNCKPVKKTKKMITFTVSGKIIQISLKKYDSHNHYLNSVDIPVCRVLVFNGTDGPIIKYRQEAMECSESMETWVDMSHLSLATAYRYGKYLDKGFQIKLDLPDGEYETANGDWITVTGGMITTIFSKPINGYGHKIIPAEEYFSGREH